MADRPTPSLAAQLRGWSTLKRLHPELLDLQRIDLLRSRPVNELLVVEHLTDILQALGLNDEGLDEIPETLHQFAGGLRVWQLPIQFAPYLIALSGLGIRSYLEIGLRHGGSFVVTAEYLRAVSTLTIAVGVDIIPCPSAAAYHDLNDTTRFAWINSCSPAFEHLLNAISPVDLVFIDSHHELEQCRSELEQLHGHANAIAVHDVANPRRPGIVQSWAELCVDDRYHCISFVDQYEPERPTMGIGLAVRREFLREK